MIVSNPPFFTTGEHSPLRSRAISRHAATLSPFSLIDDASARLSQGGTLSLITPAGMEDEMICHATFAHMYLRRLCRVCTVTGKAPVRLLWEFSTTDCDNVEYTSLTLRNPDGTPTYRFRSLTHDLYLKF